MNKNALLRPAAVLLLALAGFAHAQPLLKQSRTESAPRAVAERGALSSEERTTIGIFESASPSVVYITTVQHVRGFFGRNVMRVPQGTGSGFIWDRDGHVVTNYHVIQGAQEAVITLADQRMYPASLVGASPEHDLAVLHIDVPVDASPPLPIGSSADLKVGQNVYAIGNPFGLDHTLTTGIVSALNRSIDDEQGGTIENLIQTDAAINPGNSGGPLIDSSGRLIGINAMIFSPSGAYAGIGFAVPVDTVNRVVPRLISEGRYQRPTLGITANDEWSRRLMPDGAKSGVAVLEVEPGSPAARVGLQPAQQTRAGRVTLGDVIVGFDGAPIGDFADLVNRLDEHAFGDKVTLTLLRGGERRQVTVTLSNGDVRGVL
ncbi:MAG TPA: trypsin-like peptidase domain-containing protein [Gammaproteobacteria bacterium]|nr:trypsin-like peptidase domain-containing protein [Gammaproteobacteria bacterium]